MINLNNNADYAFSKRKSGVTYGKPKEKTKLDYKNYKPNEKQPREKPTRTKKPKTKTKIVYVKEVKKPNKKKKKKKKY